MSNTKDENWATAKQDLADAASRAGVDAGVMARVAGFESAYDSEARPIMKTTKLNVVEQFDGVMAKTSAYGYGQFTDATWIDMVHQHGEKYGVMGASKLTDAQANAPDLRTNSALQVGMLAELTKSHIDKGAALGGSDAVANVYVNSP
jgi:hypothetical protein